LAQKTLLYYPHIGPSEWITVNGINAYSRYIECLSKICAQVPNMFYAPVMYAWDSVRHDYMPTIYNCVGATPAPDGFIPIMYSDCGHQNSTGMALDAFTWYTILSGGLSAVGLNPNFPSAMTHPEMKDYLAGVGCAFGRSFLQQNGFGNDFEAPSIPAGLSDSNLTSTSFTLSWTASTDNVGVTGYEVFKNGVSMGTTSSTSMNITMLGPGLPYTMSVKAFDAVGHYTKYSQPYVITTPGSPLIVDGGFETPVVSGTQSSPPGSAWSFSSLYNGALVGITSQLNYYAPTIYDGNQTAYLLDAYPPSSSISQTVTLAPSTYKFSVWVGIPAGEWDSQPLELSVDSQTFDMPTPNAASGKWEKVSVSFTIATQGSYVLKIWTNVDSGAQCYLNFDDVSLEITNDVTPPSVPSNLTASNMSSTGFTLSWTPSTDNVGVDSYQVFQNSTQIGTTAAASLNITGLTLNNTYSYTVTAKDAAGNTSDPSAVKQVTIKPFVDTIPPTAPLALSPAFITAHSFTILWGPSTDNVGVTSYEVFQDGTMVDTTTTTSFNFTNLNCNTTYTITARAKDAAGNISVLSNPSTVKTLICDTIPPSVPSSLASYGAITTTSLTLTWTASTDNVAVTYYLIYKGGIKIDSVSTTSYTAIELTANTAYSFTIKARDAAGNVSAASSALNVTTASTAIIADIEDGISIYPNPAVDFINITNIEPGSIVSIYDLNGILLIQKITESDFLRIYTDNLPKGVYIIRIINRKGSVVVKFIKE